MIRWLSGMRCATNRVHLFSPLNPAKHRAWSDFFLKFMISILLVDSFTVILHLVTCENGGASVSERCKLFYYTVNR